MSEEKTPPKKVAPEADESDNKPDFNIDPEKETIIVAEDSLPNRKILTHLLLKLGYNVVPCEDGQIAWERIQSGEAPKLVAVISDIMMPNDDGLTLLKNVRNSTEYKDLPFVLATAVSDKEYIIEAKKLRVNGYILKPITFQRVTAKLNELFPEKKFPKIAS